MTKNKKKNPSRADAILAKCWDCMGEYYDGKLDCRIPTCPLYHWMPWAKREANLWWQEFRHRHRGRVPRKQAQTGVTRKTGTRSRVTLDTATVDHVSGPNQ